MDIGALIEKRIDQSRGNIRQTSGFCRQIAGNASHAVGQIGDLRRYNQDAWIFG